MKTLTAALILICSTVALAQPVPDSPPKEHELQIGLAVVTSDSIYFGGNNQTNAFPAIDYQYKRFYVQAGDLGFNLIDKKNWEVDFGLGVNLVGDVDRGDSRLLRDLPGLSYPLNAFMSAQYKSKVGLFKIKLNQEINNKHKGSSSSLSYAAPIFYRKWLIMPKISYEYYSEEVVNYFFGINPIDATTEFPAYQTGSANSFQLSVLGLYEINDKWSVLSNIQNEVFSNEISNSSMVNDNQRLSVFVGFLYKVF